MTELRVVAAEDSAKSVFDNLIQFYLYDMAAQSEFPLNAQGRYDYDMLERFWQHPYLFLLEGKIAGFALVIRDCPIRPRSPCWFMAEFCVLRPYQRQGIGSSAVRAILKQHTGAWEIGWLETNAPASRFWPAVTPAKDRADQSFMFDTQAWASLAFTA
ncbi:GNAT family N-acetyltransferase [Marinovum sp.]|uniref:GNAT family N-acetyltransferase n=1 Tax=Marinovum sp. TaxID=2024839 RepID=UPI002B26697F|nr:GNAT family N-acetyltransferase [Marinovum sp.]